MKKKLIYYMTLLLVTVSCITPFEPQGIEPTDNLLVVEGMLLAPYGSYVKLSRTIPLDRLNYQPVSGTVKIVSDDGTEYRMREVKHGEYVLDQEMVYGENRTYTLDMVLEGKHYRSEYVKPTPTPEISELTWAYNEKYEQLEIMVSVDNPDVDIAYYRWDFRENWEFLAPSYATHRWDPNLNRVIENTPADNRYYCWGRDSADRFILGSSEKLTTTTLRNKLVQTIPLKDADKVSYLYHINVKQYAIDRQAYVYFRNLQNNVETTGSIFAPQPTEMKGNISCVDNPAETVIGFFVASSETNRAMYIEMSDVPEMQRRSYACIESTTEFKTPREAYDGGYGILTYGMGSPTEYMAKRCVDCTQSGPTKRKPEWWPNDHQ